MARFDIKKHDAMLETLHGIASDHAGTSHEKLVLLDLDPERYPGQNLNQTTIKAPRNYPLTPEAASAIANDIDPRYEALESIFTETFESSNGISRIIEQIKSNNNVINGTDHAEIVDIALSHLALTGTIRRQGINFRSALLVSKMVDFLGVDMHGGIVPVRDVLGWGFDLTYLTIPRSISTEGIFENEDLRKYNGDVRKHIADDMRRDTILNKRKDPILLGVALPGTVNKPLLDSENGEIVVGRVNNGILDFTDIDNTETIATSIRLSLKNARYFVDDLPMRLSNQSDITKLVGRLIAGMTQLDNGLYVYDEDGDLPVIKPNSTAQ
jgi:hypothetical protein